MYEGYLRFGGSDIVNNHRTFAYAQRAGLTWLHGCGMCQSIESDLGGPWVSPYQDPIRPPWWVDSVKASHQFYGFYGVSITGADDDTREVPVSEYLGDGGTFGRGRRRTRELVVRVLAVGADMLAVQYGLQWLRTFDRAASCGASNVEMYLGCPCVCSPDCDSRACLDACVRAYRRQFRRVRIVSGPTKIASRTMSAGAMAEVEFVMVAADPQVYTLQGTPIDRARQFGPPRKHVLTPQPIPVYNSREIVMGSALPLMTLPTVWDVMTYPFSVGAARFGEDRMMPDLTIRKGDRDGPLMLRLLSPDGFVATEMTLLDVRAHEQVMIDFSARRIYRRDFDWDDWAVDLALAVMPGGEPVRWPEDMAIGRWALEVEVPTGAPEPEVGIAVATFRAG